MINSNTSADDTAEQDGAAAVVDIEMAVKEQEHHRTTIVPTTRDDGTEDDAVVPLVMVEEAQDVKVVGGRKVRFVAPTDLPAGYRVDVSVLTSRQDGLLQDFTVKVPAGGATRGQEIEAEEIIAQPILGRWYDDIFIWPSRLHGRFCPLALFLPLTAAGILLRHLGQDCCGFQNSKFRSMTIGFLTVVNIAMWFIPGWSPVLNLYVVYVVVLVRWNTRRKYKIKGDCTNDIILGWLCGCCTLLQVYRHMKMSGDEPLGCRTRPTRATLV